MSTAPHKTQQQPAAAAAAATTTSGGTGSSSSTRFRRQKIVPSVVARKIGANSSTKNSAKVASSKESPKEAPKHEESKDASSKEEVVEVEINLEQESAPPIEVPSSSSCTAEESQDGVIKDNAQQEVAISFPKPPTAFRRIKPKVAIPQAQKPAKSILKKSTTPVKENLSVEKVDYVPKEDSTLTVQENSRTAVEAVSQRNDPAGEESIAPKQQSVVVDESQRINKIEQDINTIVDTPTEPPSSTFSQGVVSRNAPSAKTIKRTIKLGDCGPQIADLLKGSIGKRTTTGKPTQTNGKLAAVSKPTDHKGELENVPLPANTLHENQKIKSTQIVVEPSKPSIESNVSGPAAAVQIPVLEMRSDNVPPVSIPSASLPGNTPSNVTNVAIATTKTIKKTYKLGNLAPQIAHLLKASIGKKTTTGKPMPASGKVAAVLKPPQPSEKLENPSLPPNTSHETQDTRSTQMIVEQRIPTVGDSKSGAAATDKDSVHGTGLDHIAPKETIVTDPQTAAATTADKVPVLEIRLDNISSNETVVTDMNPQPPPAPAENVPDADTQMSGGKQIQKVHKLTPEQWQLALKSVKKGKGKTVAVSKANKDANIVAAPPPSQAAATESAPVVQQNELPIKVPFVAPVVPTKPSVLMGVNRTVNIISNIMLPPLNVCTGSPRSVNAVDSSTSARAVTHQNVFSVSDGAVAINIPTTPPGPTTPTAAVSNVPPIDSGQYPKLIILHQPAPVSPSTSTEQSSGRLKLAQHSLSVTVLPSHTVHAGHQPAAPSPPKRPFALPTPEVTVRQISSKQTPYAHAAPVLLPTPIISVTITPATNDEISNCASTNRSGLPVDSRIVPKIVIDGCDTADPDDSQASHSSTSSSSSSGQNVLPKQQPKNRSDCLTTTPTKDSSTVPVGMGCSPDIRDKLRAKSLLNLKKKKESDNGGQLPRQYAGPAANRQQANNDANVPQHTVTAEGLKMVYPPKTDTDVASQLPSTLLLLSPHAQATDLDAPYLITKMAEQSETVATVPPLVHEATGVTNVRVQKPAEEQPPEPMLDVSKRGRAQAAASKLKQAEAQKFNALENNAINDTVNSGLSNDPEDEPVVKSGGNCGGDVIAGSTVAPKTECGNASAGNTVREEKMDLEANEFFGFSTASIDHAEQDFADRARTIDLVLAKGQSFEKGTTEKEESSLSPSMPAKKITVEVDSATVSFCGPVAENLDKGRTAKEETSESPSLSAKETIGKLNNEPVSSCGPVGENFEKGTTEKDQSSESSSLPTKELVVEVYGESASPCAPTSDSLDCSDSSSAKGLASPVKQIENTARAVSTVPDETDNTQQTEERRENIATDKNLPENSWEMAVDDGVVLIPDSDKEVEIEQKIENNNKPAVEVKDCVKKDLDAPDLASQVPDCAEQENASTLPVHQDLVNQEATGVDLIIAMAELRRQRRILSVDYTSDLDCTWMDMDKSPATKLPPPTPSTSSRGGHKKKRFRRKRTSDELVKLLWKHVNVEALVEDLVNQEKRHFKYSSTSDELSLESSDESLPEVTILKRILAKARAASSNSVDGAAEQSTECGQQSAQNDQRDEAEPSSMFVDDRATEATTERLPSAACLPARSVDPVAQTNIKVIAPKPSTTTVCDKMETNAAICDTSSSAVAELNNTQTDQVQLAPVSIKRRLATSTRYFVNQKAYTPKRPKLYRSAPMERPLQHRIRFDSSDGSRNEVVSDCSSDGLSTAEVANSSRKPTYVARSEIPPSGSKGEPGRSSQRLRRYSSSSNSNSSTTRNNDGFGHLSSKGETKSVKRRKLRRRKNCTERKTTTVVATVDRNASPSTSTTSSLDARYVVTEVAEQSETTAAAPPRDIMSMANKRISKPAREQPPEQLGKDVSKRGRGRAASSKSKQAEAQEFNVPNNSSLNNDPDDEPLVKCGNCGGDVVAAAWENHANHHNGAAYRVGIDATLNMKDVKAVSTAILRFMKIHNRKELACERCGMVKKSGVGMASHYISCGLSALEVEQSKATCVHCGRKMKAVSLLVHQQQHCRVLKEQQRQIALSEREETAAADIKETTASGRKKRKSGASAERMIKKMTKDINEDPIRELMLEVSGREVSNAILQCWMSHLQQSKEAACSFKDCPFFGMTSEHMRREHSDNGGTEPKPLYQCGKCTYMSTSQDGIKTHLNTDHPQLMQLNQTSGSDSDVYTRHKDDSTTDDYDSFTLEDADEGKGNKGGKGKKGKAKAKKAPSKAGSKAVSTELMLESSIVSNCPDETDVYKEMVLQESIEYKQDKLKYHIMSAKWTQEFRREHYVARLLFADLRPDVDISYLQSSANLEDYLPQAKHSMRYLQCNSGQYEPGYTSEKFTHRWQQKVTFEGEALGCESMFFCGGPVISLDWLPLPDEAADDCDQFLAVACKQRYDEYYNCEQLAVPQWHKCLVQIWNVGPIQNIGSTRVTVRCPRLAFAIACDYGPIWQLSFCPSGCYNDANQEGDSFDRLGLLAVAGSDGDVHLYALSRSMAGTENDASPRILPLRPVMLLSLSFSAELHSEPASDFTGRSVQRIAWSREKGHNVLAAGYSNGVVAVWNLSVKSTLLSGTKNGIRTLLPVHKVLHSSSSCITALDLHYSSGTRFLVVCNADRRLKVYDLGSGLYQPPETLSTVVRSRISAIRWLLHFPVLVIAYDDALYIDRCAYSVHQPREIGLRMFNIFTVGSEMTDLGTNDWRSMNAVATSGGDLVCHRPVPFVYGMNYKKLAQILTTTIPMKLKPVDDSVDVSYYGAFSDKYGLLFSDTDKVPTAMDTTALHLKTWRRAMFNHYPAVRLNQIRWNPNRNAYTYYAIGYQAGFVRIRVLRT